MVNHKTLSVLTALLMIAVLLPAADATTETKRYEGTMGADAGGDGTAIVWDPCWDVSEDGDAGQNGVDPSPVGDAVCGPFGGHIYLGGVQGIPVPQNIATITTGVNDDNFDATYWAAIQSDRFDGHGEENSEPWGFTCGVGVNSDRQFDWMSVWVWTAHVDVDTLETCFGSQGTVTVSFG